MKPSDTTLSYNYCVVQSVSPSCCMYLLDDVSTLHFTVWDFNLFTPNEQIGGIVSLEGLHVGGFSGHISGTSIDLSVEVTRAPYGQEISHAYDDDMQHILAESAPTPFAEVPNSFQYCVAANHFLSAETMHLAMCAECQVKCRHCHNHYHHHLHHHLLHHHHLHHHHPPKRSIREEVGWLVRPKVAKKWRKSGEKVVGKRG